MSVVIEQKIAVAQRTVVFADPSYVPFVAKLQRAKTRKNKDYFVLRTSVPKGVAERMKVGPGDYVFFRAKKAEWFHMLDWEQMKSTWRMLPDEIRNEIYVAGLVPSTLALTDASTTSNLGINQSGSTSPTTMIPQEGALLTGPRMGGA